MTERRFAKLKLLEDGWYERENTEEPVVLMSWGGSKGPSREAYNLLLEQGQGLGWYYTMFLNPMPPKLLEELREKELVLVPGVELPGTTSPPSCAQREYGRSPSPSTRAFPSRSAT